MKRYWSDIAKSVVLMLIWRSIAWLASVLIPESGTAEHWFITFVSAVVALDMVQRQWQPDRREGGE